MVKLDERYPRARYQDPHIFPENRALTIVIVTGNRDRSASFLFFPFLFFVFPLIPLIFVHNDSFRSSLSIDLLLLLVKEIFEHGKGRFDSISKKGGAKILIKQVVTYYTRGGNKRADLKDRKKFRREEEEEEEGKKKRNCRWRMGLTVDGKKGWRYREGGGGV